MATARICSRTSVIRRALLATMCIAVTSSSGCVKNEPLALSEARSGVSASSASPASRSCDVIVVGGSLSALAAGLHAAREGAATCLIEPTGTIGGQFTTEGVSPPDFAGHWVDSLDVGAVSRNPANQAPELALWLRAIGSPALCWVSRWCFQPQAILRRMEAAVEAETRLTVYREAVVIGVKTARPAPVGPHQIISVDVVQRGSWPSTQPLSTLLADWYDPAPSAAYPKKRTIRFTGRDGRPPIVIDASAFGDLLVLSGARWLQGADATDGGIATVADTCGMALVFPFALEYRTKPVSDDEWSGIPSPAATDPRFSFGQFDWAKVWTYRRIAGNQWPVRPGDVSMQNWTPGNDYRAKYHLMSVERTKGQAASGWRGGVRFDVLRAAEQQALEYAAWYKMNAPSSIQPYLAISRTWGTASGLSRMPYLRDSRRSIGLDDFVLAGRSFVGPGSQGTGEVFPDRVAIGAYQFDFRSLEGCQMPSYGISSTLTLPYYVPFRALTSADVSNLLVAGKTMAQSTLANTATRLHPTEWHTGIAAGVAAAWMSSNGADSRTAYNRISEIQPLIARWAPINWTLSR